MAVQSGLVQLVEHPSVDHLLLPADGDRPRAELLVEFLIFGLKLNILHLGDVPERVRVVGVHHVRFWRPGGLQQAGLQATEIDALEKRVVSWVIAVTVGEKQKTFDDETTIED